MGDGSIPHWPITELHAHDYIRPNFLMKRNSSVISFNVLRGGLISFQ